MQKSVLKRTSTPYFSVLSNKLIYKQDDVKEFIQQTFSIEHFAKQIDLKTTNYPDINRNILVEGVKNLYNHIDTDQKVKGNIDLLANKRTFTVTTGHQLCIYTGPLYVIYKILHTIKLAEKLQQTYPNFHFVPVYWMASEDHDTEEINHLHLFNRTLKWETKQTGAVGEFLMNDFDEVQTQLSQLFERVELKEFKKLLHLNESKYLSEAIFNFVNQLFKKYGLIILDGNQKEFKELFKPYLKKEIDTAFSNSSVQRTNEKLEKIGITPQVYSRPINLFYLSPQKRTRIIPENDNFSIEGIGSFTKTELLQQIELFPERFSPNVVLRPLYQEVLLPNLAYIGGGGEIAYWLQFKAVFDDANIPYPLVQIRNSIQLFDANSIKKMEKLGFTKEELFLPMEELKQLYLIRNNENPLDFSNLEVVLENLKKEIEKIIISTDTTLKSFAEAEKTKISNQIEVIKSKLNKQSKSKFDVSLKQIEDLKHKLFPQNGLQERHDNFLNFCSDGNYETFIEKIYDAIDVEENDLIVMEL